MPANAKKTLHATAQGERSARQRLFNWMEWDYSRVEGAGYRQQQQMKRKADCIEDATFMMILLIPQLENSSRENCWVRGKKEANFGLPSSVETQYFDPSVSLGPFNRLMSLRPRAPVSTSQELAAEREKKLRGDLTCFPVGLNLRTILELQVRWRSTIKIPNGPLLHSRDVYVQLS